jgi:hypothetical protein
VCATETFILQLRLGPFFFMAMESTNTTQPMTTERKLWHLMYEVIMLRHAAEKLKENPFGPEEWRDRSAWVENFVVHFRLLACFLGRAATSSDDIVFDEVMNKSDTPLPRFFENKVNDRPIREWVKLAHKQVAHFTDKRTVRPADLLLGDCLLTANYYYEQGSPFDATTWPFLELFNVIIAGVKAFLTSRKLDGIPVKGDDGETYDWDLEPLSVGVQGATGTAYSLSGATGPPPPGM